MVAARTLHRGWREVLVDLVKSAREELLVAAPFITSDGTAVIEQNLNAAMRTSGHLAVITDLSPRHVSDGSLDAAALARLSDVQANCSIWHVPSLHAKLYIADCNRAIVSSGNLTASAFYRNAEYGIEFNDRKIVTQIREDMTTLQLVGVEVDALSLSAYAKIASKVREAYIRQTKSVDPALNRAFVLATRSAETQLIKLRLAGGAMHTVFAKTILIILAREGPLSTPEIHKMIKNFHPDLCDDAVDRVIDGKNFGKKWKHAVRTAQQYLKKRGMAVFDGERWALEESD